MQVPGIQQAMFACGALAKASSARLCRTGVQAFVPRDAWLWGDMASFPWRLHFFSSWGGAGPGGEASAPEHKHEQVACGLAQSPAWDALDGWMSWGVRSWNPMGRRGPTYTRQQTISELLWPRSGFLASPRSLRWDSPLSRSLGHLQGGLLSLLRRPSGSSAVASRYVLQGPVGPTWLLWAPRVSHG